MPLIFDDQFAGSQPLVKDLPKPSEGPGFAETLGAAFRQENDVVNAYDLMTRSHDAKPDPSFDLVQSLQTYDMQNKTNFWNDYRENFLGVNNAAEMHRRIGRIERENNDRKILRDAGIGGVLASMTAGTISPTLFFPFVGAERGIAAAAKGAGSLLLQSGVQELPLQEAQETRGWDESAMNIASATFLGALLGPAVGVLNARERARLEKALTDDAKTFRENGMAFTPGVTAISEPFSVGAASTSASFAGGLKAEGITGKVNLQLSRIGPVTDTLRTYEPTEIKLADGSNYTYRWEAPTMVMNQLADAGLTRAGNVLGRATAEGGTVESRMKMWTGLMADVNEQLDLLYAEHVFDRSDVRLFRDTRATVSGWLSDGKLARMDWRQRIGRALFDDKPDENKFVAKAVDIIREQFYKAFADEMKRGGKPDEFFKTLGDAVYANRLWSHDKIRRRQGEFAARLAKKFEEKYQAQFTADLEKFVTKQSKSAQTIEDLTRPAAEADALIKKLSNERKGLRDKLSDEVADIDEMIAARRQDLYYARQSRRAAIKAGTKQPGHDEAIARLSQEIKDLTAQGGEELAVSTERRREINRRLQDLNKSRVVFERKQMAKLERIVDLEELAENSFEAAAKKIRRLMDQLDSYSPKEIEKTLGEIGEKILAAVGRRQKYVDEYLKTSYEFQGVGSTADLNRLQRLSDQADKWKAKAEELAEQFDEIDGADVELVRAVLRTAIDDVVRETTEMNAIRAVRQYRLAEQVKQLDPKLVDERVAALTKAQKERELEFRDAQRLRGADDVDITRKEVMTQEVLQTVEDKDPTEMTEAEWLKMIPEDYTEEAWLEELRMSQLVERFNKAGLSLGDDNQRVRNVTNYWWPVEAANNNVKLSAEEIAQAESTLNAYEKVLPLIKQIDEGNYTGASYGKILAVFKNKELAGKIIKSFGLGDDYAEGYVTPTLQEALNKLLREENPVLERAIKETPKKEDSFVDLGKESFDVNIDRYSMMERMLNVANPETVKEVTKKPGPARVEKRTEFSGRADFSAQAKKDADEVTAKILGSSVRLAEIDLLQGERGPALARMLDFPSLDFEDFLELDVEKMMRAYVRTVGPDIEMNAKFGSPNAELQLDAIVKEGQLKHDQIDALLKEGKLTEKEHAKLADQISADEYRVKENLRAVIQRLRHQRGIPDDPYALDYRMGRVLQDIATTRFMGGVVIASVPDLARPVMKYGLLKTFKGGFLPMVTNFKALKMASREARLAGTGLDIVLHQRAHAIADVFDDIGRYSKFEKGMTYLANKVGQIGLFDHWTAGMKSVVSAITIGQAMDYIETIATGVRPRDAAKAIEWLSENGINAKLANEIWSEVQAGRAVKKNGTWWPNTEDWQNPEAVRAFRAMLAREIDNTIVTPGVERPKWMDKSMAHKLVAQFKSFVMSSTTKTLMAGLQRPDMAFFEGATVSLALGALSYYLWAVASGGEEYQKMMKADAGKWADEAINRSGLLAVFQLGQDALSRTPARPFVTFSGEQTRRAGGDDLVEFVAGPTIDTLQKTFQVLTGLDDPTKATLHAGRQLAPFNKVFWFRQGVDKIEAGLADTLDLPERR